MKLHSRYLKDYLQHFRRDQILVLVYELATPDVPWAKQTLTQFLCVQAEQFLVASGAKSVNKGYAPKARTAYACSMPVILRLTEWDMDWVVNVVNWVGINRRQLFGDSGSLPPMKEQTR